MNFQAWLASEGLQVADGLLPENNLQDSPAMAWNDSISQYSSSSSSVNSDGFVLVPFNLLNSLWRNNPTNTVSASQAPAQPAPALHIDLSLNNSGLHLSWSDQGNMVASLLLHNARPARQISSFLMQAVRPILASFGPWSSGLGFRNSLNVHVQVSDHNGTLTVTVEHQVTRENADSITTMQCGTITDAVNLDALPTLMPSSSTVPSADDDSLVALKDNIATASYRGKI